MTMEGRTAETEVVIRKAIKKWAKGKILAGSKTMTGLYSLVGFCSDEKTLNVIQTGFINLKEAAEARKLCGDIIVFSATGKVVKNSNWLWDWEREDPKSYAHKKILLAIATGN